MKLTKTLLFAAATLAAVGASCSSSTTEVAVVSADSMGDAKVVEISTGAEVEIEPYLQDGMRTIVEFGAVW